MKKASKFYYIALLSLVMLAITYLGCATSDNYYGKPVQLDKNSNSAPISDETKPAEITGNVIITNSLQFQAGGQLQNVQATETNVFWIIEVKVKNSNYKKPISSWDPWFITTNNNSYKMSTPFMNVTSATDMIVQPGGSGLAILRFTVPNQLLIDSCHLCYQGQTPFSCGKLTGGNREYAYNWDSKLVVKGTAPQPSIAGQSQASPQFSDQYVLMTLANPDRYMELRTIAHWEGSESIKIPFSCDKSPWVMNYGLTPTSNIASHLYIPVCKIQQDKIIRQYALQKSYGPFKGVYSIIMEETGSFTLDVDASGCLWWIKIGCE
ncbi:MAG: hypothetical protein ABSA18_16540 [Dehalococcoidia bacterium]|jgi:hypothetical protein